MSERHLHVTSYLYDQDPAHHAAFTAKAAEYFEIIQPIPHRDGERIIGYAFYTHDTGYYDLYSTLPDATEALTGIFDGDITIVSAWEHDIDEPSAEHQRIWRIPGRDRQEQGHPQ